MYTTQYQRRRRRKGAWPQPRMDHLGNAPETSLQFNSELGVPISAFVSPPLRSASCWWPLGYMSPCQPTTERRLINPGTGAGRFLCRVGPLQSPASCLPAVVRQLILHLFLCFLCWSRTSPALAAISGSDNFFSVLTNCPPIRHLILEATYASAQATLIEFRYQPGGMYARLLSDAKPYSHVPPIPRDTSCGYLDSAFWYLEPGVTNIMPPVLTTGVETGRNKLRAVDYWFGIIFSLYASFGITPEGVNSVRIEGETLVAVMNEGDPHMEYTCTASLITTNGLPISGLIQPHFPGAKPPPSTVRYTYDPSTVPLPFPKEIVRTVRALKPGQPQNAGLDMSDEEYVDLHLLVKEIEVADPSSRLPPEMFAPNSALLGSKYEHIIITNRQSFRVSGGQLIRLDAAHNPLPPRDYRGDPRSRRWVVILLVINLFILPVVLLIARKKRNINTRKER